jgi:hypothetical protein
MIFRLPEKEEIVKFYSLRYGLTAFCCKVVLVLRQKL